jgi:hypothetical protein
MILDFFNVTREREILGKSILQIFPNVVFKIACYKKIQANKRILLNHARACNYFERSLFFKSILKVKGKSKYA